MCVTQIRTRCDRNASPLYLASTIGLQDFFLQALTTLVGHLGFALPLGALHGVLADMKTL